MLGFATSYVITMLADENPTVMQKTAFIAEKDKELESSGGDFLFGFRLEDSESGADFDLTAEGAASYLTANIVTNRYTWNDEIAGYETATVRYPIDSCSSAGIKFDNL